MTDLDVLRDWFDTVQFDDEPPATPILPTLEPEPDDPDDGQ